jgi:O-antigen/teichoic acid export membrane protein
VTIQALLSTLGVISDLGVERALPRYIPEVEIREGRAGLRRFLRRVVIIKALTLVPFVALVFLFPDLFLAPLHLEATSTDPSTDLPPAAGPYLVALLGLMLVLGAASDVSIQVLYAYFRQKLTNTLDVINAIVLPSLRVGFVVGAGAFAVAGARVIGAVLAMLLGTTLAVILSVAAMIRALRQEHTIPTRPAPAEQVAHLPPPGTFWRRFTLYSAIMYLLNLSVYLYNQPFVVVMIPLILLEPTRANLAIAGFGVAYSLVRQMLQSLVAPMNGVQTPLFSRLYAENRIEGMRTSYVLLSKLLILGLVPAGVGLIVLARDALILLFLQVGSDAVVNVDTLPTITLTAAILVVGLFGEAVISVSVTVMLVFEAYTAVLGTRLFTLISIPLLLLLVPSGGMIGAAVAVAAAGFLSRLAALIYGQQRLGLQFPMAFLGRVGLASLVMGAVVGPLALLMPAEPFGADRLAQAGWGLVTAGLAVLGAGVFYAGFRLLGGLDAADKARFAGLRLPLIGRVLKWL